MPKQIVVLDACVLFPAPLRDFLMHLALLDVFQARWTEEIHLEWIRNLLKIRPDLNITQLNRTKTLMNLHIRDCIVENYEYLINGLELPDQNDRHVLAAAIHSKAKTILTFNLKDFPSEILNKHNVVALSPDDFLIDQLVTKSSQICLAFNRQLLSLKKPTMTADELLLILENQGLSATVLRLREYLADKN
jgi:predicted nucleic acid-binding protein